MNAKKLFAFIAVAIMAIAPLAVAVAGEANGNEANAEEINEGMHVKLDNLTVLQLKSLFYSEGDKSVDSNAAVGKAGFTPYMLAFAVLFPGLNPLLIEGAEEIDPLKDIKDLEGVSLEIDYAHNVNADKTEMTLKLAGSVDIKNLKFGLRYNSGEEGNFGKIMKEANALGLNVNSMLYTPEVEKYLELTTGGDDMMSTLMLYMFKMFANGSYAEKLREEYASKTIPSDLTLNINLNAKFYLESSMKDEASDYKYGEGLPQVQTYVFKSGGYPISFAPEDSSAFTGSGIQNITVPITCLKIDGDASIGIMFGDRDDTFDTVGKIDMVTDVERNYEKDCKEVKPTVYERDQYGDITKIKEVGTKFVDKVNTAKLVVSESNKFNGASNDQLFNYDLSESLKSFIDQQASCQEVVMYFIAMDFVGPIGGESNSPDTPNNAYMLLGKLPVKAWWVFYGCPEDKKTDEGFISWIKSCGISEDNYNISHDYGDANSGANNIKNKIDGKSDNNMMVVGIVIAVIVILALVALWYFKFRPQD